MDPIIKDKWVKALRSGAYVQGQEILRRGDGARCCLGVLCEVAWLPLSDNGNSVLVDGENEGYGPIRRVLGTDDKPFIKMNDQEGKSFAEIADYIEEHL